LLPKAKIKNAGASFGETKVLHNGSAHVAADEESHVRQFACCQHFQFKTLTIPEEMSFFEFVAKRSVEAHGSGAIVLYGRGFVQADGYGEPLAMKRRAR
jgi:hypothetical protein